MNNLININGNNNNNNNNNNIVNNINIIEFGKENLKEILTQNEDKPLVNKKIRRDINNLLYNNRQKVKHLL